MWNWPCIPCRNDVVCTFWNSAACVHSHRRIVVALDWNYVICPMWWPFVVWSKPLHLCPWECGRNSISAASHPVRGVWISALESNVARKCPICRDRKRLTALDRCFGPFATHDTDMPRDRGHFHRSHLHDWPVAPTASPCCKFRLKKKKKLETSTKKRKIQNLFKISSKLIQMPVYLCVNISFELRRFCKAKKEQENVLVKIQHLLTLYTRGVLIVCKFFSILGGSKFIHSASKL